MRRAIFYALALSILLVISPAATQAADGSLRDVATQAVGKIDTDTAVHYATGINPADFPCARAAINKLYESRAKIANLKSYDPRRALSWLTDQFVYYSTKFTRYITSFFDQGSIDAGIQNVAHLAKGGRMGNPLSGMDAKIDGWIENLGPRSQEVFADQVRTIVARTTSADGTCK